MSISRSQSSDCSRRQCQHAPHAGTNDATTRSPFFTRDTSAPASTTRPAPSCPSTIPGGTGAYPRMIDKSEWHTPLAPISTTTSRGPGGLGVSCSMDNLLESPTYTAAFMDTLRSWGMTRCSSLAHLATQMVEGGALDPTSATGYPKQP